MSIGFPSSSYHWPASEQMLAPDRCRRSSGQDPQLAVPSLAGASATEADNPATIEFAWAALKESWNSGQAITGKTLLAGFALAGTLGGPVISALLNIQPDSAYAYAFHQARQKGRR
jgi:hypothetical protein